MWHQLFGNLSLKEEGNGGKQWQLPTIVTTFIFLYLVCVYVFVDSLRGSIVWRKCKKKDGQKKLKGGFKVSNILGNRRM
jgi:hypothetical protein